MKKLITLLSVFLSIAVIAQEKPRSAADILAAACKEAGGGNKNVIVLFHASWCGWCHKMDASMNDSKCKKFFDASYVMVHLTVEESAKNKNLENPGAAEMKKKYLGEKAGLPFWLIFDKKGRLLADSYIRKEGVSLKEAGDNIGCPAAEDEVAYFTTLLKKTSHLSDANLSVIAKRFRENDIK